MERLVQHSAVREMEPQGSAVDAASDSSSGPGPNFDLSASSSLTDLLWLRRRLFMRTAVGALLASTLIVLLIPSKYDATTSIMPPDSAGESGLMLAALAGKASPEVASLAGGLMGAKTSGAIVVALLGSRTVQQRIVDRFDLQKAYWKRHKEDARQVLSARTTIGEDRKSGVITITVRDHRPERARDMAQAYVEELNRLMSEVSTSSARRQRIFIEQRLGTVSVDLANAEKGFSEFASKNTVLDVKEQTKAMVESAATLQGELIAAQSELQALQQVYSANNVRVRAAHARVAELKGQLQKIEGSDSSLLHDSTPDDSLYPSIRKLPLLGVQWADLYRRMKTQETVYELLTQQYEMARIQEAKEIPSVSVVDAAETPETKAFPPRLLLIGAMTGFSVIFAVFWVVGVWRLNQLEPDDPRKVLAMRTADAAYRLINDPTKSISRSLRSSFRKSDPSFN